MFYENQLKLLRETFGKCHVPILTLLPGDPATVLLPEGHETLFEKQLSARSSVQEYLGALAPRTMYKRSDAQGRSCIYFLLPATQQAKILFVGPYLTAPLSREQLLEIGESHGISPQKQRYLEEYYQSIPVLGEEDRLLVLLDSFCEQIWQTPSFAITDVAESTPQHLSPLREGQRGASIDDVLVNMKAMEQRYSFENELIRAVSMGQMHKERLLLSALSEQNLEKRLPDSLRNVKNYAIIMNTLLRKAAESGGVHPLYLDSLSSDFAQKIEQMSSPRSGSALMHEMFRAYCRLVHRNARKHLSRVVQQTLLLIDADLAGDLGANALARAQNVSLGYLSTVFRKEMGKTLSQYVREKRLEHAAHLLATTQLQVQTVALHCGILDVQYFSKIFKKEKGLSPKDYRCAKQRE